MIEGPVVVVGATGNVGRELVRQLSEAGVRVSALTRHPDPATDRVGAIAADVLDADRLRGAFASVRQVFLAAPIPVLAEASRNLVRATRDSGVDHIVLLSSSIVELDEDDSSSRAHREAEAAVTAGKQRTTTLRPGSFHSNALRWVGPIAAGEPIPLMAPNVRSAPIDPSDIARVAMRALDSSHDVPAICTLAGAEQTSLAERVDALAEVLDRAITWEQVPVPDGDLFLEVANRADVPWATATDAVERLTGRPARSFRDWAVRHRARFA